MDFRPARGTTTTLTHTIASLATSATWVAGYESAEFDCSIFLDVELDGKVTVGTTPTANTIIEVWVIPRRGDATWPDVFDGTDSAETVTSRGVLESLGAGKLTLRVDANTSNRVYNFWGSVCAILSVAPGSLPTRFSVFIVHNTGVNLNSTGSNHETKVTGLYVNGT